jgi:ribosomal protein S18 acetylase RimI-like enzyme
MQIVYQGKTKTGKQIIVRYPKEGDEKEMCRYINELSKEKTFVRFQGEEILLENEANYLVAQLERIKAKTAMTLFVFEGDKLIAIADINMLDKTEKHLGVLALSVAKNFRGEGIGKLLMDLLLKEAEKELSDLKIITLDVYQANVIAQKLYKELGFVEYGMLPNGVSRNNTFEDRILMYKNLRQL